jgi:hypothetical protein
MATRPLKEVDTVEILTILDNTVDMLVPDANKAKRPPRRRGAMTRDSLIAEDEPRVGRSNALHRLESRTRDCP